MDRAEIMTISQEIVNEEHCINNTDNPKENTHIFQIFLFSVIKLNVLI